MQMSNGEVLAYFDMPYFICPRCAWRGARLSRTSGFSDQPVGCETCGFGFLFELLDDYFPSPKAGIFVCGQDGRIIATGKGSLELAGFYESEIMGFDLAEALELNVDGPTPTDEQPHLTALEWGVRVLDKPMTMRVSSGKVKKVTGDFFPAYDKDGGLLAVFTPRSV